MDNTYRRVNITVLEQHYEQIAARGLTVSGLIRDLLGDYLSANTITLQVSDETRALYDRIIANTGATDTELEVHLRAALAKVLEEKIRAMQSLHQQLVTELESD